MLEWLALSRLGISIRRKRVLEPTVLIFGFLEVFLWLREECAGGIEQTLDVSLLFPIVVTVHNTLLSKVHLWNRRVIKTFAEHLRLIERNRPQQEMGTHNILEVVRPHNIVLVGNLSLMWLTVKAWVLPLSLRVHSVNRRLIIVHVQDSADEKNNHSKSNWDVYQHEDPLTDNSVSRQLVLSFFDAQLSGDQNANALDAIANGVKRE